MIVSKLWLRILSNAHIEINKSQTWFWDVCLTIDWLIDWLVFYSNSSSIWATSWSVSLNEPAFILVKTYKNIVIWKAYDMLWEYRKNHILFCHHTFSCNGFYDILKELFSYQDLVSDGVEWYWRNFIQTKKIVVILWYRFVGVVIVSCM